MSAISVIGNTIQICTTYAVARNLHEVASALVKQCPRQCVVRGHAHSVSQDIRIGGGVSVKACRRRAWSSPRLSSRDVANPRLLGPTGSRSPGSPGWSLVIALEGESAFTPRSRRPHTSPHRLPQTTIELVIELREKLASKGLDHGPHTIAWHLQHHHSLVVSVNSIHRHLRAGGYIDPQPHKRPKSSYIRFAAEQPNERWQADFTHWWLADHTHVEILNWIDDHARYALSVTAHRRVTAHIVLAEFRKDSCSPWCSGLDTD